MNVKNKNKVNFYEYINEYEITKYKDALDLYVEELWKDLSAESIDVKKGISKEIFLYYYDVPRLINQHIFIIFDKDKDNFLNFEEFKNTIFSFFYSNDYDILTKLIFDIFDCDRDGYISDEDCRLMLSYIPITGKLLLKDKKCEYDRITFEDRMTAQEEIFKIVRRSFQNNIKIKYSKFCDIIEKENSDLFIHFLIYLLEKRPFNENILNYYIPKNIINENDIEDNKNENKEKKIIKNKKIIEQSLIEQVNSPQIFRSKKVNFTQFIQNPDNNEESRQRIVKYFYKRKTYKLQSENNSNNIKKIQEFIDFEKISSSFSGYVFKITTNDKLKVYFIKLEMQDLFYYKNRTDKNHIGMHHITYKTYLRKNKKRELKGVLFYNFSLVEPRNTHNFFFFFL